MRSSWICLVAFFVLVAVSQGAENGAVQECMKKTTCGQCIGANPKCAWCKQEDYGLYVPRCDFKQNLIQRNCTWDNIISPNSTFKILKDHPLSEAGSNTQSYVQMKPQQIRIKLRPHETISFPVVFRQAEDYPLDLYYLMDLTYSMRDDKKKLSELGNLLADSISNLTRNFRLGFGSFVDKVVLPYVSTVKSKLDNPCLDGIVCAPPYGFRNHMPLSNDSEKFSTEVANANVSANLDDAEGGFDAIMQVIVCKVYEDESVRLPCQAKELSRGEDKIDWHSKARKIILFATDSGFHYAGDGKLGGIVVPNDCECHLDDEGYYTKSTLQDYPSLSQIKRVAKEHNVIIIFAVPTTQLGVYTQLSDAIELAHTRELAQDSANIVELVKAQYNEISSEVELRINDVPDYIRVTFSADCPGEKRGSHVCQGIKVGTTVNFNVSIRLEDCPKNSKQSHKLSLSPQGLSETLEIQLETLCDCDCELPHKAEMNSPRCFNAGSYECGVCNCNDDHFGRLCNCSSNSTTEEILTNQASCKMNEKSEVCSGRGDCICGECSCHPRANTQEKVDGQYCQCDNFTCPRDDKQRMCGGPERGYCSCKKCVCEKGWTDEENACTCTTDISTCIDKKGGICNGNGECKCGQCVCIKSERGYEDHLCDDCPDCGGKCDDLRPCVECQIWQMGHYNEEECRSNCTVEVMTQTSLPEALCIFTDEDGCTFRFTYSLDASNITTAYVLLDKDCPQPANVLAIILGVAGGIVIAGILLLLIARLIMFLKDRRDYARFLEQVKSTTWGQEENPIYKAAISNYTNPTYGTAKPVQ